MDDTPLRLLVTGAAGFVGRHLLAELGSRFGARAAVTATARLAVDGFTTLDVTDTAAVTDALRTVRPTHVINLAAIAAPADARSDPDAAWRLHARAPAALGRAILATVPGCWLLHVSSGMVYGRSGLAGVPLAETAALAPLDEYAVTKAAGDLALGALVQEGLRCVVLRPFNHTGPGQSDAFAIPAFAAQVARIEAGLAEPVLRVGNLDAVRDFLDVRDVARAYAEVVAATAALQPGTVLNVASGVPVRMEAMLAMLLAASSRPIRVEPDPSRLRPSDLGFIVGDAARLRALTGWAPAIGHEAMLLSVLESCRRRAIR
jgi:GDP-4-dehydro-6-deoxy-D-mannose reductase